MYLDYDKKINGVYLQVTFDAKIKENELNMRKDMKIQAAEMLESAGFKDVKTTDNKYSLDWEFMKWEPHAWESQKHQF